MSNSSPPTIILIAGASGSGKSNLCRHLLQTLSNDVFGYHCASLSEDHYYHDQPHLDLEARKQLNYDHPDAIEESLLLNHLDELKKGRSIDVPEYDFSLHRRKTDSQAFPPPQILLIDGILVLSSTELRKRAQLCVYIDTPQEVCLSRRIQRDTEERGRSEASVIEQYKKTVKPMFQIYVAPSKQWAHVVVSGQQSVHAMTEQVMPHIERQLEVCAFE